MGIGNAMMKNPEIRKAILERVSGNKTKTPEVSEEPKQQTPQRAQVLPNNMGGLGFMGTRLAANNALRVRPSELSPSAARRMNRKGG